MQRYLSFLDGKSLVPLSSAHSTEIENITTDLIDLPSDKVRMTNGSSLKETLKKCSGYNNFPKSKWGVGAALEPCKSIIKSGIFKNNNKVLSMANTNMGLVYTLFYSYSSEHRKYAVGFYDEAIKLNPNNSEAYLYRAASYLHRLHNEDRFREFSKNINKSASLGNEIALSILKKYGGLDNYDALEKKYRQSISMKVDDTIFEEDNWKLVKHPYLIMDIKSIKTLRPKLAILDACESYNHVIAFEACDFVINSGAYSNAKYNSRNLGIAYNNRGVASRYLGNLESAAKDFLVYGHMNENEIEATIKRHNFHVAKFLHDGSYPLTELAIQTYDRHPAFVEFALKTEISIAKQYKDTRTDAVNRQAQQEIERLKLLSKELGPAAHDVIKLGFMTETVQSQLGFSEMYVRAREKLEQAKQKKLQIALKEAAHQLYPPNKKSNKYFNEVFKPNLKVLSSSDAEAMKLFFQGDRQSLYAFFGNSKWRTGKFITDYILYYAEVCGGDGEIKFVVPDITTQKQFMYGGLTGVAVGPKHFIKGYEIRTPIIQKFSEIIRSYHSLRIRKDWIAKFINLTNGCGDINSIRLQKNMYSLYNGYTVDDFQLVLDSLLRTNR